MNISSLLDIGNNSLILASASPRRKQLLELLGIPFTVQASHIDENISELLSSEKYVLQLSEKKAREIAKEYLSDSAMVIAADTIVVLDGKILNKPDSSEAAYIMLRTLSNRTHVVYTGITIVQTPTGRQLSKTQKTEVTFRFLSDEEIWAYIATGSPFDKAGGYGIQDDFGAVFVQAIAGCYYNVVGLPLEMLYSMLKQFSDSETPLT